MSDLALFAIFENGHIPADQVYCTYYFYEFNLKINNVGRVRLKVFLYKNSKGP